MRKLYFDMIPSTQTFAKGMARNGVTDEIYIAKVQTDGVGRTGNTWLSVNGGLYFSFVKECSIETYTILVGVAIHISLKKLYNIHTKIKWPNDILLNNKKIAGIICEKIDNKIVTGIGINTNFEACNFNELSSYATTIKSELNIDIDNDLLLDEIINNINTLVQCDIVDIFMENMAYLNEERYVSQLKGKAIIKGINENGELIVFCNDKYYNIDGGII